MWVLDPGNSRELLDSLRAHASSSAFEVVWCGEGWRQLVASCHLELVAACPDYRFSVIKQRGVCWPSPPTQVVSADRHSRSRYSTRSPRGIEWPRNQPVNGAAVRACSVMTYRCASASKTSRSALGASRTWRRLPTRRRPRHLELSAARSARDLPWSSGAQSSSLPTWSEMSFLR